MPDTLTLDDRIKGVKVTVTLPDENNKGSDGGNEETSNYYVYTRQNVRVVARGGNPLQARL